MAEQNSDAATLAYSIEEAAARANIGRTMLFSALKAGALKGRKIGRRTVVLDSDLRNWLEKLPVRELLLNKGGKPERGRVGELADALGKRA
jgi:hypothetical protein